MTIDWFVLLAPIFLLGVMALLGFVGCDLVFGLDRLPDPADPPVISATPGDNAVTIDWEPAAHAVSYVLARGETAGSHPDLRNVQPSEVPFTDTSAMNGKTYFYVVRSRNSNNDESADSNEVMASPSPAGAATSFVKDPVVPGALDNTNGGFFGMTIEVQGSDILVRRLGRFFLPGNGGMHSMAIIDKGTNGIVPNSPVTVDMTTGTLGNFVYADVTGPVTLFAGHQYYIVSSEAINGDKFSLDDCVIDHENVARVIGAASGDGTNFTTLNTENHTYGPVNFLY